MVAIFNKKKMLLSLAVVLLIPILTGCTSNEKEKSSKEKTENSTSVTTSQEDVPKPEDYQKIVDEYLVLLEQEGSNMIKKYKIETEKIIENSPNKKLEEVLAEIDEVRNKQIIEFGKTYEEGNKKIVLVYAKENSDDQSILDSYLEQLTKKYTEELEKVEQITTETVDILEEKVIYP